MFAHDNPTFFLIIPSCLEKTIYVIVLYSIITLGVNVQNFEIKNILSFQTDKHAGEKIIIRNDFSEAEIYLLGGQLTHFQPIGAEKVIPLPQ